MCVHGEFVVDGDVDSCVELWVGVPWSTEEAEERSTR